MKKLALVMAVSVLAACGSDQSVKVENTNQKASYAIGYRTGQQMQGMDDLELDQFLAGLRAGAEGKSDGLALSEEDMNQAIADYQQEKISEMAKGAQDEGDSFRAENAKKDGVTTLDSGLQYEVLTAGEGGAKPTLDDTIVAHYHGTLIDGTVFDSSVERGAPATFPLAGVIKGWQDALQLMSVGDKWRIVLPPELAYGERGTGAIPPGATLVFEVELVDIKPQAESQD
ncbi:FKBP-type peptidyl-prolyl cis-trans isomerase [Isoalcanivorax beigongshangi]|uniref:Peptidyl-prolyl cis-trans isomerase n=1 Tax=Isoalcanivorax beigongshangi TaxID=3238810 RepID=A0ABV4ADJ4_9GAMM